MGNKIKYIKAVRKAALLKIKFQTGVNLCILRFGKLFIIIIIIIIIII